MNEDSFLKTSFQAMRRCTEMWLKVVLAHLTLVQLLSSGSLTHGNILGCLRGREVLGARS